MLPLKITSGCPVPYNVSAHFLPDRKGFLALNVHCLSVLEWDWEWYEMQYILKNWRCALLLCFLGLHGVCMGFTPLTLMCPVSIL